MESEEMLTVQQAAEALGVHANTIRTRIKSGQYEVIWAPSPHGPRQLIPRSSLVNDASQTVNDASQPRGDSQSTFPSSFGRDGLREHQELAIQQVVSPFLDRLEVVLSENNRLHLDHLDSLVRQNGLLHEERLNVVLHENGRLQEANQKLEDVVRENGRLLEANRNLAAEVERLRQPAPEPPRVSWWSRLFSL